MAVFEYKALNENGKSVSGIIDADGLAAAQDKLKAKGVYPIALERLSSGHVDAAGKPRPGWGGLPGMSGIKSSEISMATRLIATLLGAGFPLVQAVETVAGQTRSRAFEKVLSTIKNSIEEGSAFADALGRYPHLFSSVYINMVSAGEASGSLEVVLERLADFSERRDEIRKEIQAALAYPVLMSLIGTLVLVILLTYIVPGIIQIFSDMNQVLPLPTLILVRTSDFFSDFWWAVLLVPVAVIAGIYSIRKTERGLWMTDRILLALPLTGSLVGKAITARFSRTLGSLLENGIPLLGALQITKSVTGNVVISDLIQRSAGHVEQGGSLGESLAENRFFPNLAARMIQVGEKSGEMEKMLQKSSELYERDVRSAVTAATALIEPIIILVMGVVVGLIIMAVCLPIVEMNQLIV